MFTSNFHITLVSVLKINSFYSVFNVAIHQNIKSTGVWRLSGGRFRLIGHNPICPKAHAVTGLLPVPSRKALSLYPSVTFFQFQFQKMNFFYFAILTMYRHNNFLLFSRSHPAFSRPQLRTEIIMSRKDRAFPRFFDSIFLSKLYSSSNKVAQKYREKGWGIRVFPLCLTPSPCLYQEFIFAGARDYYLLHEFIWWSHQPNVIIRQSPHG